MRFLILSVLLCSIGAQAEGSHCTEDVHCRPGSYCNTSFVCQPCIVCDKYSRLNLTSHKINCPKQVLEDCGACKPGYVDGYAEVERCVLEDDHPFSRNNVGAQTEIYYKETDGNQNKESSNLWVIVTAIVVILIIITLVLIYKFWKKLCYRFQSNLSMETPFEKAPPPPYSSVLYELERDNDHRSANTNIHTSVPTAPTHEDDANLDYKLSSQDDDSVPYRNGRADASTQQANLANPPHYVRLPPSANPVLLSDNTSEPVSMPMENVHLETPAVIPSPQETRLAAGYGVVSEEEIPMFTTQRLRGENYDSTTDGGIRNLQNIVVNLNVRNNLY